MPTFILKSRTTRNPGRLQGFTLVELLVVMAIIGALAAIAIPAYNNYIDKARITVAHSALDAVRKTFESFHIDYQGYPSKPLNLSNGTDSSGRTVFSLTLLQQVNEDITFVSYNTATNSYTFVARAKNRDQTLMTMTPTEIAY